MDSVLRAVGGVESLIDYNSKDKDAMLLKYLGSSEAKIEKLLENPKLIRSPIVRNGKQATLGYCPEVWEKFE